MPLPSIVHPLHSTLMEDTNFDGSRVLTSCRIRAGAHARGARGLGDLGLSDSRWPARGDNVVRKGGPRVAFVRTLKRGEQLRLPARACRVITIAVEYLQLSELPESSM
eukprot:6192810-Pleurochrysis_carterae.AAC.1